MEKHVQIPITKAYIKSLVSGSKALRKEERKQLCHYRAMKGVPLSDNGFKVSYRHNKEEARPEPPVVERKLPEDHELYAEEAFARYWNLHQQRTIKLRQHARDLHIVYSFLKGKKYSEVEQIAYSHPGGKKDNWDRLDNVLQQIIKDENLNSRVILQRFAEWISEARDYYKEKNKKGV